MTLEEVAKIIMYCKEHKVPINPYLRIFNYFFYKILNT